MTAAILICVGVSLACLAWLWWAFATAPVLTDDEIAALDAWLDQQRRDAD